MSSLTILHYPNPKLRDKARPVNVVDGEIRGLVDDMFHVMYAARGIGLAAIQVGIRKRVIVVDVSRDGTEPIAFINPEIVEQRGRVQMEEGCLSVPDVHENVERAEWIRVKALNRAGEPFEQVADGILAVCIQHEMDHLEGRLFVDYLSRLKRQRILTRAKKQQQK